MNIQDAIERAISALDYRRQQLDRDCELEPENPLSKIMAEGAVNDREAIKALQTLTLEGYRELGRQVAEAMEQRDSAQREMKAYQEAWYKDQPELKKLREVLKDWLKLKASAEPSNDGAEACCDRQPTTEKGKYGK